LDEDLLAQFCALAALALQTMALHQRLPGLHSLLPHCNTSLSIQGALAECADCVQAACPCSSLSIIFPDISEVCFAIQGISTVLQCDSHVSVYVRRLLSI
jgi:hypothetical protein